MTPRSFMSNKDPEDVSSAHKTHKMIRIYKQNSAYTKDAASYALGVSNAMAFTVPVESHKLKRQTLDPNFSKRRVNMMEDGLYNELEQVLEKIAEYGRRGEEVPISELYFCYTVGFLMKAKSPTCGC